MSFSSWLRSLRSGSSRAHQLRQRPSLEVLEDRSLMNATLSITGPSWSNGVWEGDKEAVQAVFTVFLSEPASETVTVNFATADGTAKAKNDYVAKSGMLTFAPGETSKTIIVEIKSDNRDEEDEYFSVNLSDAIGAVIESGSFGARIVDDDNHDHYHCPPWDRTC